MASKRSSSIPPAGNGISACNAFAENPREPRGTPVAPRLKPGWEHSMKSKCARAAAPNKVRGAAGFSLLELLVVIAIIALLAAMLLPAFARAREKSKVVRAQVELNGVGVALEMYSEDNAGKLPPVRVDCNTDLSSHWCQFPIELAEQHYLGRGNRPGMAANMEDVFNPNHTYKYAAPGPRIINNGSGPGGNFQLWVPNDAPNCASTNGQYFSSQKDSPIRWVLWSLGPRPDSSQSLDDYAPMIRRSWYRQAGGGGVIARFQTRTGVQFVSQ
jgi:prepilin-type N-terminal cleavage/methylation domain-containing protein